jgi:hypothetical protein
MDGRCLAIVYTLSFPHGAVRPSPGNGHNRCGRISRDRWRRHDLSVSRDPREGWSPAPSHDRSRYRRDRATCRTARNRNISGLATRARPASPLLHLPRGRPAPSRFRGRASLPGTGRVNDFSFDGVHEQIERRFGHILRTPLTPEQEAEARRLIELDEQHRIESMRQYERDGVVPFMRKLPSTEASEGLEPPGAPPEVPSAA